MAPLPHNSTAIYYVDYSFAGQGHTMEFRTDAETGPVALLEPVSAFLEELSPLMASTWRVEGARAQAAGANFSLPVAAPPTTITGTGTLPAREYPRFVSFVGRGSQTGRRMTLFVYGLAFTTPDTYRFVEGTQAALDNARGELINMASSLLITIGGDAPYFQSYCNVGFNSYWERERRP